MAKHSSYLRASFCFAIGVGSLCKQACSSASPLLCSRVAVNAFGDTRQLRVAQQCCQCICHSVNARFVHVWLGGACISAVAGELSRQLDAMSYNETYPAGELAMQNLGSLFPSL
jgi:hypothetical protein